MINLNKYFFISVSCSSVSACIQLSLSNIIYLSRGSDLQKKKRNIHLIATMGTNDGGLNRLRMRDSQKPNKWNEAS